MKGAQKRKRKASVALPIATISHELNWIVTPLRLIVHSATAADRSVFTWRNGGHIGFPKHKMATRLVFQTILCELVSFLMRTISFVPIDLHRCWPREWKRSMGSLRYHDGYGGENLTEQLASRSLKLQCDYPNSLTLSNVTHFPGVNSSLERETEICLRMFPLSMKREIWQFTP